jgi:hypothetical protein
VFKPDVLVDVTFLAPKAAESAKTIAAQAQLYLPQQLVHRDETGAFVWLADQSDEVARKTAVTTGAVLAGAIVEISSGLDASSRVIARGHEQLSDGQRIRVAGEEIAFASTAPAPAGAPPIDTPSEEGK